MLDPGQCWTRAGFAGEDTPKSVIPSHYGYVEGAGENGARKQYFGDSVHAVRAGMEVANPMSDGIGILTAAGSHIAARALTLSPPQLLTGTLRRRSGDTRSRRASRPTSRSTRCS